MLDYISLLLGALIGFLGSMGMFFVEEMWHSRTAVKLLKIEISLILKNIDGIVTSLNETLSTVDESPIVDIPTPKMDTQFYSKSIDKIAFLGVKKVSEIKSFYFCLDVYQHAIEKAILNKGDNYTIKEWLKKALNALTYAKDLGTKLTVEL